VLAARGQYPPDALRRRFPGSAKLGSVERIAQLVGVAVPGIGLHPMAVAPPQLPFVAQTTYFELDKSSERFRELRNSAGIAIHVPGEDWPKDVELELWAIRPEG
jgi:type VI secretion system protein ImpJ